MKTTGYKFTNKLGYTVYIYVHEITDKSVFYGWADETGKPRCNNRNRMSLNSFKVYVPIN